LDKIVGEARGRNLFFSTDVEKQLTRLRLFLSRLIHPLKPMERKRDGSRSKIHWCRQIAKIAKDDKIVVEKSTLPVRTAEAIKSILDNGNGVQFQILSNPEFLAEGTAVQDLLA
jgi:UDPglucose 6-dehydrogenase